MICPESLSERLCRTFCASVSVNPVPCGYAVSTIFMDNSGDPIGFYVVESDDGIRLEDDGDYLAKLIGSGLSIDQGAKAGHLNSILGEGGAFLNQDTLEIQSETFSEEQIDTRVFRFLTALIQIRNFSIASPAAEKSRFREDATEAIKNEFGNLANFAENEPVNDRFSEFIVDLVIRPLGNSALVGALYFVSTNEKLGEALLLQMDTIINKCESSLKVIAIIEDCSLNRLSKGKFQRAQNRSLAMPIYGGDKHSAIDRVGREMLFS